MREREKQKQIRVLFAAGMALLGMEVWKQYYLYAVVNDRVYDPWFFPFQLCSVPMYLCVLLPLFRGRIRETVLGYLWDYGFFGAVLALIYPEGLIRTQILLTLHGFLWHILLILIGLYVLYARLASGSWRGFFLETIFLLFLCVMATVLNVLLEGRGMVTSYPDMFYLTPFHHTTQPVAREVETMCGRPLARLLYVAALVLLAAADHLVLRFVEKRQAKSA